MNEQTQLTDVLKRMEDNSRRQLFYARLQCGFSVVAAICCVILLFIGIKFLPQVQTLAERSNIVLSNLEDDTNELSDLDLSGLENVVYELSTVDLNEMVDHVDSLITTSHEGVKSTMDKLNEINFDALNQTIEDLSKVVERLAKITKIFG